MFQSLGVHYQLFLKPVQHGRVNSVNCFVVLYQHKLEIIVHPHLLTVYPDRNTAKFLTIYNCIVLVQKIIERLVDIFEVENDHGNAIFYAERDLVHDFVDVLLFFVQL